MAEPQKSKEKLHLGGIQGKDEMVWANYTENNRNPGQSDTAGRMFCLDYGSEYIWRARCGNSARWELCGVRRVTGASAVTMKYHTKARASCADFVEHCFVGKRDLIYGGDLIKSHIRCRKNEI